MRQLLIKNNLITSDFKCNLEPYSLRVKGLNEKLTNQELACALINIAKRRGSSFEIAEEDKTAKEGSTKLALSTNDLLLKSGKYVCEIQYERLINKNKVRGHQNNFRTRDYVNEAKKILENQDLNPEVKEEILNLIARRREYFEGPGSQKSPTEYGRYIDFNQEEPINLIEKMRGKCSIYPDQLRAPKNSFTACLYNFLNDLNNIRLPEDKRIDKKSKEELIEIVRKKGGITVKQLANHIGYELAELSGFRVNKKEEPIISEFKGYKEIVKALGLNYLEVDTELIDEISEILTNTKSIDERKDLFKKLNFQFNDEQLERLANITSISGYHSLSFKALNEINEEMLTSEYNQMQILSMMYNEELLSNKIDRYKGKKNIEFNSEAVLSPVAKRAHREALKVINRLREIYGEFDTIVIETTRQKNSKEQKKAITDTQKYFEGQRKEAEKLLEDANINRRLNKDILLKIRLYNLQDAKTAYELHKIDFNTLVNDPTAYEIDHIIPISISFDDSINNKVLVTRKENQAKGNLTPLAAFDKGKFTTSKEVFIAYTLSLRESKGYMFEKKKNNLLTKKDITKFSEMQKFINRNIVDTSYANRVVLNTLQDYFKANNIGTKVHTIKGTATHMFRSKIKLDKVRDDKKTGFAHHAIDALIVAALKKFPNITKLMWKYSNVDIVNKDTGEIVDIIETKSFFDEEYLAFIAKLMSLEKDVVKFSYKINTKPNRSLSDETIYSTRNIDGKNLVVKKVKDIYDKGNVSNASISGLILKGKYDQILMYKHDKQTFDKLVEIVNHYKEAFYEDKNIFDKSKNLFKVNPFYLYLEEHNQKITKYSKKGNGPVIEQMKYFDGELGNHIDISDKYDTENKKVVLLQLSPFRTDFYHSETGGYKFVTIYYNQVKYSNKEKLYIIDTNLYEQLKMNKKIDDTYTFVFSMHRDELIKIVSKGEIEEQIPIQKFIATNNDKINVLEVKPLGYHETKQIFEVIGRKTILVEKYATDVCGNMYKVSNQTLKLKFK